MTELALRLLDAHLTSWRWLRRLRRFLGPGFLVAVGYMDPGNWATDMAAGAAMGYALLWVVLAASMAALLMQYLSAKLGVITGRDLAELCRARSPRWLNLLNWVGCEIAICACDLAEVIGGAIALKLLFGLPVLYGVALTILDALIILWLTQRHIKRLEMLVYGLIAVVASAFVTELVLAQPDWAQLARGAVPSVSSFETGSGLFLAIGIVGATVMPHNLYLHSALVRSPERESGETQRARLRFVTGDLILALILACAVNAAMLVLAGSAFHAHGLTAVDTLERAWTLLQPELGSTIAPVLFAVALLAAGQSATLTATLAGQTIMQDFTGWRISTGVRRLVTRLVTVVPTLLAVIFLGEQALGKLLIGSQVVLSLQLPFAMAPLIRFTGDRTLMGRYTNAGWLSVLAWSILGVIVCGNLALLTQW